MVHTKEFQESISFAEKYAESGWFDREHRFKTYMGLVTLCKRLPKAVRDSLPPLAVYAPSPLTWGELLTTCDLVTALRTKRGLIYLTPELEKRSQAFVDETVAHEFAHVVLGHNSKTYRAKAKEYGPHWREREADLLIEEWGYTATNTDIWKQYVPKRRQESERAA